MALALALALSSAALGYSLGASTSPPQPALPAFDALAAEVRDLAQQIARLQHAITKDRTTPAVAVPAPTRETVAADRSAPPEPGEDTAAERDEAWRRIAPRVHALETTGNSFTRESLRRAREQNPQPHLAAVDQLLQQLREQPDNPQHRKAVERQLWLLGMDEVVQRLGMPSNVIAGKESLLWEYWLPGDRQLTLSFRDGVVVRISD